MIRVAIIGVNGQVAQEVKKRLTNVSGIHVEVFSSRPSNGTTFGKLTQYWEHRTGLKAALFNYAPNFIVNAVAYTDVDGAEQNKAEALDINAYLPKELTQISKELDSVLIHFSTNYVYDGCQYRVHEYREIDQVRPINYYGFTKLRGDQYIEESGCRYVILRTAGVFSQHNTNFVVKTLQKANQLPKGESFPVVVPKNNPIIPRLNLTSAATLANVVYQLIEKDCQFTGIFNCVDKGYYSIDGLVAEVLATASKEFNTDEYNKSILIVDPLDLVGFGRISPAKRPFNTILNIEKLKLKYGIELPRLEDTIKIVIKEISKNGFTNEN
jgi:dTDP-4-dehydrorhamnose reductase